MQLIESFSEFRTTPVRNLISVRYQGAVINAFLVTTYLGGDGTEEIAINETIEILENGVWIYIVKVEGQWMLNQAVVAIEIINLSVGIENSNNGGDTYITNIDNSIQFGTYNGESFYGIFTYDEAGVLTASWFSMDGSPYTGDVNNITIVEGSASFTSVDVKQCFVLIDAVNNTYFDFLQVLAFVDGRVINTQYLSYFGVVVDVDLSMVLYKPTSVTTTEVYQFAASPDEEFEFNSAQYFDRANVELIQINLTIWRKIRRLNGRLIRPVAMLHLGETLEVIDTFKKIYTDYADEQHRIGTRPKVTLSNGAELVCDLRFAKRPNLTRSKSAYDAAMTATTQTL